MQVILKSKDLILNYDELYEKQFDSFGQVSYFWLLPNLSMALWIMCLIDNFKIGDI